MIAQFLVAAAHSNAGKTTVTLGLLRAFQRQGLRVQPFKCGPDYIDPLHHKTAAGHDSINLDAFMMSSDHICGLYHRHSVDADVCIAEGVMGLFDGARRSEGSSAALATLLDLPIILVLNAKAMAYTAAALLYGLKGFDPRLRIAGVIFNFVDSPSHYRLLEEACEDVGVKALGHLPTNNSLHIPARHLGLDTADASTAIEAAADHITRRLDLSALLTATAKPAQQTPQAPTAPPETPAAPLEGRSAPPATPAVHRNPAQGTRRILIARDPAFHFLYPENIRRLEQWGRIEYFSPLRESHLPEDTDLLYLPGGYPELYPEALSNNNSLLQDIRAFAAGGKGKILAECGGMMFLGHSITDESGKAWPMTGLLDIATSIEKKKLTLGYRSTELAGHTIKGHEFHYSQALGSPTASPGVTPTAAPLAITRNSQGQPTNTPFFFEPNIFASYMHVYWGEDPSLLYQWLG